MLVAPADCFVGNKPRVAAAATVAPACVAPARDVALVRIRNSEREPVDLSAADRREMENVFVAIIQETTRTDWLEMSAGNNRAALVFDRDRFDPVNRVLQLEQIAQLQNKFVRQQRIGRRSTEVKKKRTGWLEQASKFRRPLRAPIQIIVPFFAIKILSVRNPKIVRR